MTRPDTDRVILNVADIYCGAGGLSAGFSKAEFKLPGGRTAGFRIVYGLDKDQDAVDTFNAYHARIDPNGRKDIAVCKSVTDEDVNAKNILKHAGVDEIDVLIGGPNCQGVSMAGLRNPGDKRNEMFRRFLDLIKELQPNWFVMENVPGLVHANNRELLCTIMSELSAIPKYRVEADILLAAHFRVPQFRYRVFFVGNRTGVPIWFPRPKVSNPQMFTKVKEAIGDLPFSSRGNKDSHEWMELTDKNKERIRSVEQGGDWRDMPIRLLPERLFATRVSDQKGTYGRLEWEWPAYTITSSVANVTAGPFTHPEADRPLSVREAARLQSFDDCHEFKGRIDSKYRQVGNAVPPLMAEAVAEAVLMSHFEPVVAKDWGRGARITRELLEKEHRGSAHLPALTPRFPGRVPRWDRKPMVKHASSKKQVEKRWTKVEWRTKFRPSNPYPKDLNVLTRLAEQPGNYRAAKRAKAILDYFNGYGKASILKDANKSQKDVEKWILGFLNAGLQGWRAYHSSVDMLVPEDLKLTRRIGAAIAQVRKASSQIRLSENGNKRLHMNDFLVELKSPRKFGDYSVRGLISEVEKRLGHGIGTFYVGDLLAVADVVFSARRTPHKKAMEEKAEYQVELPGL